MGKTKNGYRIGYYYKIQNEILAFTGRFKDKDIFSGINSKGELIEVKI